MLPSADTTFDYAALSAEKAASARAAAERIRLRMTRAVEDIISAGRDLADQKKVLGHGNFLKWIEAEFSLSQQTASNMMRVASQFGDKLPSIGNLGATALYLLASDSTPEPVRTEVIERAAAGEKFTAKDIETLRRKLAKAEELVLKKESQRSAQETLAAIADRQAREAATRAMFAEADKERLATEVHDLHEEIDRLKEDGTIHVLAPPDPISAFNDAFVAAAVAETPWTDADAQLRVIQAVWKETGMEARVQFMRWAGLSSLSDELAA